MRRLLCLFLLLFLPLHTLAMQGSAFARGDVFDIAHEIDHLEGVSHHHDDHGAPHYDESGESAQHFAEHSASHPCLALPSDGTPLLPLASFKAARSDHGYYIPDPVPERPQRPPQSLG